MERIPVSCVCSPFVFDREGSKTDEWNVRHVLCLFPPLFETIGTKYALSGALAGTAEHVAMYPLDTIKTRMQALGQPGQNLQLPLFRALRSVLKREGIIGLYRGVPAVAISAGPAHAVYFGTYELAKEALGGNKKEYAPGAIGLAGAMATIGSDLIFTPADVVKQRLQLAHSPYQGVLDCISRTLKEEGVTAFFRSLPTTLVMNVPFTAVHFSVYEFTKHFLNEGDKDNEGFTTQLAAGGMAGGCAAAVTTPLDVVKTRLQTQGVLNTQRYNTISVLKMLRRLYTEEGLAGLTKGIRPRILFHTPSAAICWTTYETGKSFFRSG